jgi:hypothetical protein
MVRRMKESAGKDGICSGFLPHPQEVIAMQESISKLAAYGLLIDAQRWLRKQENTGAAIAILRKAEDALRVELWNRRGFGNC